MSSWKEKRNKLRGRTENSAQNSEGNSTSFISKKNLNGRELNFANKPKYGRDTNRYDILPFKVSADWYKDLRSFSGRPTGLEVGDYDYKLELPVHGNVPGCEKSRVVCLKEAFGQPCPICQEMERLMTDEGKNEDIEGKIAPSLKPKWRVFYNVIDLNDDQNKIVIFESSYHLFEKQLLMEVNVGDQGLQFFWDIEDDGKTIEWRGERKSFGGHNFVVANRIDFVERKPYDENILDECYPLDQIINILKYEQIQSMMLGVSASPSNNENDTLTTKTETKRSRFGRRTNRDTVSSNKCSQGLEFGKDFSQHGECQSCEDDEYDKCEGLVNNVEEDVFEDEVVEEQAPTRRTRRSRR